MDMIKLCAKKSPRGDAVCWRAERHLGLHRDHPRLSKATYMWSDREYTPEDQEATHGQ